MKKRILVDAKLLDTYMEYVAKGDVTPDVESFFNISKSSSKNYPSKENIRIKTSTRENSI